MNFNVTISMCLTIFSCNKRTFADLIFANEWKNREIREICYSRKTHLYGIHVHAYLLAISMTSLANLSCV